MYKIAITNRSLCTDLLKQIEILNSSDFDYIILREKDLSEDEYFSLAKRVLEISNKTVILHHFVNVALRLNYNKIHLSMNDLRENSNIVKAFEIVGASTHSLDEAIEAKKLGATYITASHIFETDCKRDLQPKGLTFLKSICKNTALPVYALGGIDEKNASQCIESGAKGVCMMSQAMKYK